MVIGGLGRSTYEQDAESIRPLVMERGRLTRAAIATDTAIYINTLPRNVGAYHGWAVIDPYTTECEVRQITARTGKVLTIAALTYAHDQYDEVLFIDELVLSAKWWGAKGDGVTNDTTALQRAAAAATALTGSTLHLPAGNYSIVPPVDLGGEMRLIGDNQGSIITASAATFSLIRMRNDSEISNVKLVGFDRTVATSIAIEIGGDASYTNLQCRVRNIRLGAGFYYGVYGVYEMDSTLIERVDCFDLITKAGIYIAWDGTHGSARSANVIIRQCHLSPPAATLIGGSAQYGIFLDGVETILLENNIVNNFDCAIFLNGTASTGVYSAKIHGLHVEERRTGIYSGTRWSTGAVIALNAIRLPTKDNASGFVYKCTDAGTTGGTEPTWPTTYGGTVADGGVVWTAWARSVGIEIATIYISEIEINGWISDSFIIGLEDKSGATGTIRHWHNYVSHDHAFSHSGSSAAAWTIGESTVLGNFKPYGYGVPGSGSDAAVVFENVSWTSDDFGYVPDKHGVSGYMVPLNFPKFPRVTTADASYTLDIRSNRIVLANSTSANVTVNLPAPNLPDEGIEITVFKYAAANSVIVDANTVGGAQILSAAGWVNTRTIATVGGHITLTPITTPAGGVDWLVLSESL